MIKRFTQGKRCLYFQIGEQDRVHFVIDRSFKTYIKCRLNKPDLLYCVATQNAAIDKIEAFIEEHPTIEETKHVKEECLKEHEIRFIQQGLFT